MDKSNCKYHNTDGDAGSQHAIFDYRKIRALWAKRTGRLAIEVADVEREMFYEVFFKSSYWNSAM